MNRPTKIFFCVSLLAFARPAMSEQDCTSFVNRELARLSLSKMNKIGWLTPCTKKTTDEYGTEISYGDMTRVAVKPIDSSIAKQLVSIEQKGLYGRKESAYIYLNKDCKIVEIMFDPNSGAGGLILRKPLCEAVDKVMSARGALNSRSTVTSVDTSDSTRIRKEIDSNPELLPPKGIEEGNFLAAVRACAAYKGEFAPVPQKPNTAPKGKDTPHAESEGT